MKSVFRASVSYLLSGVLIRTIFTPVLLASVLLLTMPQAVRAATYTVCLSPGVCDYLSPETAVNDPIIVDGDTIDITPETYVLGSTLQVDNSITILAHNSIFDANGIQAINVFSGANLSLTFVTIRNGQAGAGVGGGALSVSGGSIASVFNSAFENNRAEFGGAIHNSGSTINLRDSVFTGNQATAGDGGAVLTDSGGLTYLTRISIDSNQATVAGGGLAVAGSGSQLNFIDSTISNNAALLSVPTVSNLAISGTTVSCGPGEIGQTFTADALALSAFDFNVRIDGLGLPGDLNITGQVRQGGLGGPVIATASAFASNTWPGGSTQTLSFILDQPIALIPGNSYAIESAIAGAYTIHESPGDDYPGGIGYTCGSPYPDGGDFYFRTFGGTPGEAGGIYASAEGTAGMYNTTVSGNLGDGAVAAPGGIVHTLFSTIASNSGNGLTAKPDDSDPGLVFIYASILANNAGNDCNGGTVLSSGYNLIGDDTNCIFSPFPGDQIGTAGSPIDPLLGPLQNNGGITETHSIDDLSPAIDGAGSPLVSPCSDAIADQRGVSRPQNPACDIGAFEHMAPLQQLINSTSPGATVVVPNGIYTESISLGNGITLQGSGPAGVAIDASGFGSSAIVATGDFTLQGLTVTGGHSPDHGGGIVATLPSTNIALLDVIFDNNAADLNGGAIYLLGGSLTANNVTFSNNSALRDGGAIHATSGKTLVFSGDFNNNTAGDFLLATAGDGGAIAFIGGSAGITSSVFSANRAFDGDGVSGRGGSIFNDSNLSIVNTTIETSTASIGGGVFNNEIEGLLSLGSSTLSNNSATNTGAAAGGAIAGAGTIEILNSTISGNTATDGHGGGIALTAGRAKLNNITAAFNAAPFGQRGALFAEEGALITLSNSLLSGNSDSGTFDPGCDTVNSLGYNLSPAAGCLDAATDITALPRINGLASNGGPTETHSLQALSPAINAGHPVASFTQFDADNFSLLQTQGETALDSNTLRFAGGVFTVGSAFVINPIDPSQDFSATFQFQIISDVGGAADGFTFTISDDPTALGDAGGFLGIGERDPIEPFPAVRGVINGVSVEFDTWLNGSAEGANDPDADHIGIDFDGSLSSEVLFSYGAHNILSDGNIWTAWIVYDAGTSTLEVRAANDGIRPASPTVSAGVDIASLTGPNAYVGFTGASGSAGIVGEPHILSFSFANSCEVSDQRGVSRPEGAGCDIGAFEEAVVPPSLSSVVLRTLTFDQLGVEHGTSYPGVVDIPIIDIPIEKLTGDSFNEPASAPLGSFPLGSFPIGSFDLKTSPLGSFPLGSFPIGSFPLGSFPLGSFPIGSFPLSSIPLLSIGGWAEILNDIPELAGAPLQTVTLEQLLTHSSFPDSVAGIELRDLSIQGSPLGSFSMPGLSLGATTVEELDQWVENAGQTTGVCDQLAFDEDNPFTDCGIDDTLLSLEYKGAPVSALSLSSLPLGSFEIAGVPIGSFPLGSFPIGSFPLGSFPLGSFPLGSFPIGSFPLGSFPLGSFPLGSFPLGSFNLLAAPTSSLPLGSFPLGSFPLGSFELDGMTFCEFYDAEALEGGTDSCESLGISSDNNLADLVEALQRTYPESGVGSTPLGSFPLGSFPIGSFPIGSFGTEGLSELPLSLLTLADFDGCRELDGTADCSTIAALSGTSSLLDVATEYGTMAASPLGSFPIGSFDIADMPLGSFPIGSFPLGSFEINGTPLGSFPLGSFDLISSPLGSFLLDLFTPLDAVIDDPLGLCSSCLNLTEAEQAGVIRATATLYDLAASSEFADTTFGEVLDAMSLAMLYGPGTLADIEDAGNLTLGQLLISMMLKSDFPWETIALAQLDAQAYSADNFVAYNVYFELESIETDAVSVTATLTEDFHYVNNSASLRVDVGDGVFVLELDDPEITDNEDGTQTLSFDLVLDGFGLTKNTISFTAVSAMTLGDYPASATVQLGENPPVDADATAATVSIVPDPRTDYSSPESLPTSPANVLLLGFINHPEDNDFYRVAPSAEGDRVAVFMSNPAGDNDLIMYEPLSTVELKGQSAESPPLDSVPFEDDGVNFERNSAEEPNALEDINLLTEPLASISTNRGDADESVSAVAGDDAPFTLQVSGYNGASSDSPYTLRIKVTKQVPVPECSERSWPDSINSTVLPAGEWLEDTNAVFLVNGVRLASSEGDADAADAALSAINNLIHAPGVINGVVVDVADIHDVDYNDWDTNPCDVDAANAIVNAITAYLEEQRVGSPRLAYVTIVGSDEVIPFARKPDETSIANESTFAGEFFDNAMYGALVTRHFLSDDSYGDIDPIPWWDRYLNVPELGVGRLVESAEDIRTAAENYIAYGGALDPRTALSAGYDFIADAAEKINNTFDRYSLALGYDVEPALIDQPGVDSTLAWTREDFLAATRLNSPQFVDLVSFNMHFDFDEALPSSGDALGSYTDNLITTTDLGSKDMAGGIWFTVGCHSGTNLADVSVVGSAPSEDWAQAFSRLGATYLAQNAYGLGDTEAVALTERLLALFARNLNGSMTIGQAHAFSKQRYFADLGLYGEYDYKAMQASTLFGLPMYQYVPGGMVDDPYPDPLPITLDPISGLASASWPLSDTDITQTTGTSKGDLFSVDGEVQFVHFRPLQPIVRRDVTSPDGEVASGAFLTSLTTEDIEVADIAFARPVIALGEIEPEIESDEIIFPTAFTNISNFKAPPASGGPFEPRQQLNLIVGQFSSPMDGHTFGIERLFRSFDTQIFYRATPESDDYVRPEFDKVQASLVGEAPNQQAAFSVDVTDNVNVSRVAVLYLQSITGGMGNWVLVDLIKNAGSHTWTGGGPVDLSGFAREEIDYMLQAVDSNGNVANSTFKGEYHVAGVLPPAPGPGGGPGSIDVVVTVDGEEVDPDAWITADPVDVVINHDPETHYVYSVDFSPFEPLTSAGFQITGDGVHIVTVQHSDGSNSVTFAILIDTQPPQALLTTPAHGEFVVQGLEPAADFDCLDAGSGIRSCVGTVSEGSAVPSATTGLHSFAVSAQDNAGLGPVMVENEYYVIQQLEIAGPVEAVSIGSAVNISAAATDLEGFEETATIDWGDGSPMESIDLDSMSLGDIRASHHYSIPDVYQIRLSVDYEGQFTQVGVLDSVAVYDANGGFVTGNGWIISPPSAVTPNNPDDPFVTGKAHFGLTLRYKKGKTVPIGSTNFRFTNGGLEFDSTSYHWMIISGARVRYQGEGTVNEGSEPYKFMVTALDADSKSSGISEDGFRIKIWQENEGGIQAVLYDSGLGANEIVGDGGTTPLGGGSVKIHQSRKK